MPNIRNASWGITPDPTRIQFMAIGGSCHGQLITLRVDENGNYRNHIMVTTSRILPLNVDTSFDDFSRANTEHATYVSWSLYLDNEEVIIAYRHADMDVVDCFKALFVNARKGELLSRRYPRESSREVQEWERFQAMLEVAIDRQQQPTGPILSALELANACRRVDSRITVDSMMSHQGYRVTIPNDIRHVEEVLDLIAHIRRSVSVAAEVQFIYEDMPAESAAVRVNLGSNDNLTEEALHQIVGQMREVVTHDQLTSTMNAILGTPEGQHFSHPIGAKPAQPEEPSGRRIRLRLKTRKADLHHGAQTQQTEDNAAQTDQDTMGEGVPY